MQDAFKYCVCADLSLHACFLRTKTHSFHFQLSNDHIEITSWAEGAYGIFTRVGDVSEIERASEISDTNNE